MNILEVHYAFMANLLSALFYDPSSYLSSAVATFLVVKSLLYPFDAFPIRL